MKRATRWFLWLLLAAPWTAWGQIAQEPLLNRPNAVSPNMLLILDTSGSMDISSIYEYGAIGDNGPVGPNPSDYAFRSPDVNKLYYDPRVRYLPRVAFDGTFLTADPPTPTNWTVNFAISYQSYPETGGTLTTQSGYWAPYYVPLAGSTVPGSTATYPNRVLVGEVNRRFPKFLNRTDCLNETYCTMQEERQNHSNWNKWYRTRGLAAQTGIGRAIRDIAADSIRLGYADLGQLAGSALLARGVASLSDGAGGTKDQFLNWLYARSFDGGTPNRRAVHYAGRYFARPDSDGPWATQPNPASLGIAETIPVGPGASEPRTHHASCRRSFTLLVTDGYWNGGPAPGIENADALTYGHSAPGETTTYFAPIAPDTYSRTLADVASHYWGTDLRPDLENRVPSIVSPRVRNDSFWQNSSFYAITLGLLGTVPRSSVSVVWPQPQENTPTTIDDTWHATINGRGELINANNAGQLGDAIRTMMESIAGSPQTLSGVAVSGAFVQAGSRKFKPKYVPGTWNGQLTAVNLNAQGHEVTTTWMVELGSDSNGDPLSGIPAPNVRRIFTWNGAAGVPFSAGTTGLDPDLVNYVRGDPSKELRKQGGIYRNRTTKLGDIVNSNPLLVQGNVDLGYEALLPAGAFGNYRDFVADKKARSPAVVFVGANDGMLHAFRDGNGSDGGAEIFAYVPKVVVPELRHLAESPMTHRYYVDGPLVETDAYLNNSWRNILLGTTGAGPKAVFALDITRPLNMTATNVMWEVDATVPGFSGLGHVLGPVQAGILPSNQWVALFGNGPGSPDGTARLFVVDLRTGGLLKNIAVPVVGGNGLGAVRPVLDNARRIVGAYAGDLKGNLWKFDLTDVGGNWGVALGAVPLFSSGPGQAITAAPTVLPHTTGYVVAFGTGKFFETGDGGSPYQQQQLYGIWDAQPFGAASTPAGAAPVLVNALVEQSIGSITTSTTATGTQTYYTVSTNSVDWGNGLTGVRGWKMRLPGTGERLIYPLQRLGGGTFVMASTMSPESTVAPDVCVATGSGSAWVYIFDGVTGSGPTKPVLDTNGDGNINSQDLLVSGYVDRLDGGHTPVGLQLTSAYFHGCIESSEAQCRLFRIDCGQVGSNACPPPNARFRSRSWRQLFMR